MISEGLMTTIDADGAVHLAPMGPTINVSTNRLVLRPFTSSQTHANLRRAGEGVFHITDDVLLLARSAVGAVERVPDWRPAAGISGAVLKDACRWFAVRISRWEMTEPRATAEAEIVDQGEERPFWGFNRAKHAVLEAAILATRVGLLEPATISADLARWRPLVEKTGGPAEREAWAFLEEFIRGKLPPR